MKVEVELCCERPVYEAPGAEIVGVDVEKGFSLSGYIEDVDKDEEVEF